MFAPAFFCIGSKTALTLLPTATLINVFTPKNMQFLNAETRFCCVIDPFGYCSKVLFKCLIILVPLTLSLRYGLTSANSCKTSLALSLGSPLKILS